MARLKSHCPLRAPSTCRSKVIWPSLCTRASRGRPTEESGRSWKMMRMVRTSTSLSLKASCRPTIGRAGPGISARSRHLAAASRSFFLNAALKERNIAYGDRKSAGTSPASFPWLAASAFCQRNSRIFGKSRRVLPANSHRPSAIRWSVSLVSLLSPISQSGPASSSGITGVGTFVDRRINSS